MYLVNLDPLQMLILALSATQSISLFNESWTREEKGGAENDTELSQDEFSSLASYPYHAIIISNCSQSRLGGIILTERHIISTAVFDKPWKANGCGHIAQVGADAEDSGVAYHEAEILVGGLFTLFKLKVPIKFGRRARKIQIALADSRPEEEAYVTFLTENTLENTTVITYNVTVVADEDLIKLGFDLNPGSIEGIKANLWIRYPEISLVPAQGCRKCCCLSASYPALINKHGRLIGITDYDPAFRLKDGTQLYSYIDLAPYKALIHVFMEEPKGFP